MKIVGVISSANLNGNGATLAREALRGAAAAGAAVTEIYLPNYHVEFCTGCLRCMAEGRCFQPDEFESLRDMIYGADGIILSTPTFGAAPNARMKNLFDRLGLFEYFTSNLGGKHVAVIATASRPGAAMKAAKGLARLATGGAFQRGYVSGVMGAKARPQGTGVCAKDLRTASELGGKLARDIKAGRMHPFQNPFGALLNRLVVKPMLSKALLANKDGMLRGVFANLKERELI